MNTHIHQQPVSAALPQVNLVARPAQYLRTVASWYRRAQSRIALSNLDQHLLDDIGVSVERAKIEAHKPFWKD